MVAHCGLKCKALFSLKFIPAIIKAPLHIEHVIRKEEDSENIYPRKNPHQNDYSNSCTGLWTWGGLPPSVLGRGGEKTPLSINSYLLGKKRESKICFELNPHNSNFFFYIYFHELIIIKKNIPLSFFFLMMLWRRTCDLNRKFWVRVRMFIFYKNLG